VSWRERPEVSGYEFREYANYEFTNLRMELRVNFQMLGENRFIFLDENELQISQIYKLIQIIIRIIRPFVIRIFVLIRIPRLRDVPPSFQSKD
jgi:hypothetical protein